MKDEDTENNEAPTGKPSELDKLAEKVLTDPAKYMPRVDVIRLPPPGQVGSAPIGTIALDELPVAQDVVSRMPKGGPGTYRATVRDAKKKTFGGSADFDVLLDNREPEARAQPAPAAPVQPQQVDPVARVLGALDTIGQRLARLEAQAQTPHAMPQPQQPQQGAPPWLPPYPWAAMHSPAPVPQTNPVDMVNAVANIFQQTKRETEGRPPSDVLKEGLAMGLKLANKEERAGFLADMANKFGDRIITVAGDAIDFGKKVVEVRGDETKVEREKVELEKQRLKLVQQQQQEAPGADAPTGTDGDG